MVLLLVLAHRFIQSLQSAYFYSDIFITGRTALHLASVRNWPLVTLVAAFNFFAWKPAISTALNQLHVLVIKCHKFFPCFVSNQFVKSTEYAKIFYFPPREMYMQVANALLEWGADPNSLDAQNNSALHLVWGPPSIKLEKLKFNSHYIF